MSKIDEMSCCKDGTFEVLTIYTTVGVMLSMMTVGLLGVIISTWIYTMDIYNDIRESGVVH